MKITLELSDSETQLLATHLARHVEHLDAELVRTDKHDLQHALAREVDELRALLRRLQVASGG